MRIYTKTGDGGETGLVGGARVPKDHLRIEACGAVDEVNAALGWVAVAAEGDLRASLARIQHRLFDIGAELATPEEVRHGRYAPRLQQEDIAALERTIDRVAEELPPLRRFILPGGSELAARLHWARTVVRRAERRVVALHRSEPVRSEVLLYLNRLSDLLFLWARRANAAAGIVDPEYRGEARNTAAAGEEAGAGGGPG